MIANRKDITAEQNASFHIEHTIEGGGLTGKTVVWILQRSEGAKDPIILRDQDVMTITDDTATVSLSAEDTDWTRNRWYELWVDWGQGQWQKQFKGTITLKPSGSYGN